MTRLEVQAYPVVAECNAPSNKLDFTSLKYEFWLLWVATLFQLLIGLLNKSNSVLITLVTSNRSALPLCH